MLPKTPKPIVNLFYMSPNPYGGWVTFTAHLFHALEAAGCEPRLFKIGNNTEAKTRPYGYGLQYRNVTVEDAATLRGVNLITAMARNFVGAAEVLIQRASARIVIHDPTELKHKTIPEWFLLGYTQEKMVVIRRSMLAALPGATFIPHPFLSIYPNGQLRSPKAKHAVSTCRIDFDKHTEFLLDANRLLPDRKKIEIRGFENRLYTKFKILPKYPEWVQSVAHYDRQEWGSVYDILQPARWAVDMSEIKGDGGGTQYSFLEAIDAGCGLILNTAWQHDPKTDVMREGVNCVMCANGKEIAQVLKSSSYDGILAKITTNARKLLADHDPPKIGKLYRKFLDV